MDSNGIERSWMVQQIQHHWRIIQQYGQQAGTMTLIMSESVFFEKISAYVAENKRKAALEAELSSTKIDTVLTKEGITELEIRTSFEVPEDTAPVEEIIREESSQRLDAIYDEEPLGFEKDPMASNIKMLAQDPLEEVNLGDNDQKRITYISAKLEPELKATIIKMLKENRDCFAWDYDEMPGLGRDLVELKLPIK